MNALIFFFPYFILFLIIITIIWIGRRLKPKQQYGIQSVTQRGEIVKSIAERKIADYFEKNNIKYVYEKEAKAKALFLFSYKVSSPDFYLPDYNVYVEYWGLVNADDDWTRENYVRNMRRKMAIYHRNKIKFISIYPHNLDNLDWIFRKKFEEVTGFKLPK
jgi:hypothetical protein